MRKRGRPAPRGRQRQITFALVPEFYAQAIALAETEGRPVAKTIETIVEGFFRGDNNIRLHGMELRQPTISSVDAFNQLPAEFPPPSPQGARGRRAGGGATGKGCSTNCLVPLSARQRS
jgi:hypothetical protein